MTILLIACDLYGIKVNIEVDYAKPLTQATVADILSLCQTVFENEAVACKPSSYPNVQPVDIGSIQVYNDATRAWEELVDTPLSAPGAGGGISTQVIDYTQLYAIQRDPNYVDTQQQIPPARKPSAKSSAMVGVNHQRVNGQRAISTGGSFVSDVSGVAPQVQTRSMPPVVTTYQQDNSAKYLSPFRDTPPPPTAWSQPTASAHQSNVTSTYAANNARVIYDNPQQATVYHTTSISPQQTSPQQAPLQSRPAHSQVVHTAIAQPQSRQTQIAFQQQTQTTGPNGSAALGRHSSQANTSVMNNASALSGATAAEIQAESKSRFVFDEMDLNGDRLIDREEWSQLITGLGVSFSRSTLMDLFQKADQDRDGKLLFPEFNRFFSHYTMLLDTLHFRLQDVHEARRLQSQLEHERQLHAQHYEEQQRSHHEVNDRNITVQQLTHKLRGIEAERQRMHQRERELETALQNADDDLQATLRGRDSSQAGLRSVTEKRSLIEASLDNAQRSVGDAENRLRQEEQLLQQRQSEVQRLTELLRGAQREAETQAQLVASVKGEVTNAVNSERNAMNHLREVETHIQACHAEVVGVDEAIKSKQSRRAELVQMAEECRRDILDVGRSIEDIQRQTNAATEQENQSRRVLGDHARILAEADSRVAAKVKEIEEFNRQRSQMEAQEQPLLEQEVRLKEQRSSLDEKETVLQSEMQRHFYRPGGLRSGQHSGNTTPRAIAAPTNNYVSTNHVVSYH